MSTIPALPVELLRLIADNFRVPPFRKRSNLDCENRKGLRSLCLTSRVFREIAQPILFEFIRSDEESDSQRLQSLVSNNRINRLLSTTRALVLENPFDTDEDENPWDGRWVKDLFQLTTQLLQARIAGISSEIVHVTGMGLRRLFLDGVTLSSETFRLLSLPSLEVLSIYRSWVEADAVESLTAHTFPMLRHLLLDDDEGIASDGDRALVKYFAPQLDSIILMPDIFTAVASALGSLSPDKILFNTPWCLVPNELVAEEDKVVHLRILVCDIVSSPLSSSCPSLDLIASLVGPRAGFPRLETVYLPPSESMTRKYSTEEVLASLRRLVSACERRNIEVVFEEQSEENRGETQISEEFTRRMTRKRMKQEAEAEKDRVGNA